MAQAGVAYQATPKGDQQCGNCSLFQPPSACTLVDGMICPTGWCNSGSRKLGDRDLVAASVAEPVF
jgi:hypothetical protein